MASPITLEITFSEIILRATESKYDVYASSIAGHVDQKELGVFKYKLSAQNLEKINKVFDGVKLPKAEVVKGQSFLDQLREKYRAYKNAKSQMQDILKTDWYPLEPNGKFFPYKHQTKIVGSLLVDPFCPVAADCGTGKTGSTARAIELLIQQKKINKGKVLVTAPLSILEASWADDIKKFTNLNAKVLWTPRGNKTLKIGDRIVLGQGQAEKPVNAMTVKVNKSSRWVKGTDIKPAKYKLDVFDEAEGGWEKMEVMMKEALMPDGTRVVVGPIYGQKILKENTKELWMQETLRDPSVDLFLINHDGVRLYEEILKEHGFEWVVVDESTKIKSPSSQVFKSHVKISWNCQRRTILSGTPNPNGFMDLWAQFYFLDRGLTLSTSIKDFRHDYFTPISLGHFGGHDAVKWDLKDEALKQALIDKIKNASIFLKQRDCVDLPPRTDMVREVVMTAEQSRVYTAMEKDLVAELMDRRTGKNVTVEAVNTLTKLMKLRQITSGFVGHSDGVAAIESFANNPKYEEMDSFIEELGDNKLVISCQFKEEIISLLNRYKDLGAAAIYGEEKPDVRRENIKRFQTTDELKIMILQPQAAAHGITLTDAHYFAFLSLDYNFEHYYQVGKRIERIGQKNPMFVHHFLAKTDTGRQTIDHDLMHVLKSKSADRDVLFDGSSDIVEIAEILTSRLISRVNNNN